MTVRVAIWKSAWLPASETFVRNQIDFLTDWTALPVGMRKVTSPLSADGDRILFGTSRGEKCRAWWLAKTGYSRRLREFLREEQADVLHAHFAGGGMIVRRSAKRSNVPLVVTLHGQDITAGPKAAGAAGAYYRFRLRRLFRDATILIAVSQHIADVAQGLGAEPHKVLVHHIGIPVVPKEGAAPVQRQILAVGRLIEKKGIAHLIGAMALLPADLHDVTLRIVGDGPLEGELKSLAQSLGVNAEFMGFLPSASVRELMSARPLVCIPSVVAANGDEEGLPTVAMEAAAEKCAVVASRHSGLPDVVEDELTGLLVAERDEAALAAALTRLLRDPALAGAMGERGHEKILAEFDMHSQTILLESIYERARAQQK
jgi:colanic acid/amylovoran biosynthesis glycosyltransferase